MHADYAVDARNRRIYRPEKVPREETQPALRAGAEYLARPEIYPASPGKRSHRRGPATHCAAYNGGPGNLRKWQRRARKGAYTDALMFIESIPARETRIFIERVLSNLWMYRERLGEPALARRPCRGRATGLHRC